MYLDYFGLASEPFSVTPDPDFLYLSQRHKEALGSIIYGVEKRLGFVAIIGEVGTGKTTILRSFLTTIDLKKVKPIYIFCPNVPFAELIKTVIRELSFEPASEDPDSLVQQLLSLLIIEYQKGFNVVLIIDEAQNTPVETLANLHMLSNLETTKNKLIQIILTGQPELDQKLNLYQLRQLKQRLASRATILQLTAEESCLYIDHRLKRAGAIDPGRIFTKPALDVIVAYANGNPRTLNIICNQALIAGFAFQEAPLSEATVVQTIAETNGCDQSPTLTTIDSMPRKSAAHAPAEPQVPPKVFEKPSPAIVPQMPKPKPLPTYEESMTAQQQQKPTGISIPKNVLIAIGAVIILLVMLVIIQFVMQMNAAGEKKTSSVALPNATDITAVVSDSFTSGSTTDIYTFSLKRM